MIIQDKGVKPEDVEELLPIIGQWSGEAPLFGPPLFRIMADGRLIGVHRFTFTWGLLDRIEWQTYGMRWCYRCQHDAFAAMVHWSGEGDPPGPWIKAKGFGRNDHNPLLFKKDHRGLYVERPHDEIDWAAMWPLAAT